MALQTVCAESKEERILPLLSRQTRAQHARSTRIDNVPLLYAEMSGDELDQRIAAAMANIAEVEECWQMLHETLGDEAGIIPVTYMNSAANLKAFCGSNGGIVCTSSNAPAVIKWAFSQGKRVLFFPDEHLGRNTALKYGIAEEQMAVWNPKDPMSSIDAEEELERSKIILWKGYCTTHMRVNVQQIAKARAEYPGIKILVHPECRREVVEAADLYGSTEYIIQQIEKAPAGSQC